MSEQEKPDPSSQTEHPTPRKKEKARESGTIAQSREVTHFLMLSALLGGLGWVVGSVGKGLISLLKPLIESAAQVDCDPQTLTFLTRDILAQTGLLCAGFIVLFMGAIFLSGSLQTQWSMTFKSLKPKIERISPISGLKRLFSSKSLVEFLKGLAKLGLIVLISFFLFGKSPEAFLRSMSAPELILEHTNQLFIRFLWGLIGAMVIVTILDYSYEWYKVFRGLFMSRQEIKEEYKDQEGDPLSNSRQKQLQKEFSQMRNLPETIPEATVILTNPSHYAVALRWTPRTMTAPLVIAKGTDRVARRIRDLAQKNYIPIVENPPLARLLYASVKLGDAIHPAHYQAVADVIRYVMKPSHRKPTNRQTSL